ncbi:MAG: cupin domain-containing protein [Aureliella sp.]
MPPNTVRLNEKLASFTDQWSPKIVAEMGGFHFKLAKLEGDFVWHQHDDTDEAFMVISGELRIDFRDGQRVLKQGDMLIVPSGVEHKPFAEEECEVMIFVRAGTVNTGSAEGDERTADPYDTI